MKKRRHHYVWQHYLKAWAFDGQIACCRDGHVFRTSTTNVAIETDFYRLREFTDQDLRIIRRLFVENLSAALQDVQGEWMRIFGLPTRIKELLGPTVPGTPAATLVDEMMNNVEEELHAQIENGAITYLQSLRNGEIAFLESSVELPKFLHFIAVQFTRTAKMRSEIVTRLRHVEVFDVERCWNLMSHLIATNISSYLYSHRDQLEICLLNAGKESEIITSDQPVVNLRASNEVLRTSPEEFHLYYPLSPEAALLVKADQREASLSIRKMEEQEVGRYNRFMFERSHQQVFAASEATLVALHVR